MQLICKPIKRESGKEAVMDFRGLDTPPEEQVGIGAYLLEKNVPGEV